MTPPTTDEPQTAMAEAEGPVKPGIYLEERKSTIGTGVTAKTSEYRTFWVTLTIAETTAVLVLLDDDFKPTGIKQTFTHDILLGDGWYFIAEGEKRYQRLRPYLDRMLAPPAPKKAAAQATKSAGWWTGESDGPAKDPFALDKKPKKEAPAKKGGWWES